MIRSVTAISVGVGNETRTQSRSSPHSRAIRRRYHSASDPGLAVRSVSALRHHSAQARPSAAMPSQRPASIQRGRLRLASRHWRQGNRAWRFRRRADDHAHTLRGSAGVSGRAHLTGTITAGAATSGIASTAFTRNPGASFTSNTARVTAGSMCVVVAVAVPFDCATMAAGFGATGGDGRGVARPLPPLAPRSWAAGCQRAPSGGRRQSRRTAPGRKFLRRSAASFGYPPICNRRGGECAASPAASPHRTRPSQAGRSLRRDAPGLRGP